MGNRETRDGRQEIGDGRQQIGGRRQEKGERGKEKGYGRPERQETGDLRQETGDGRQETVKFIIVKFLFKKLQSATNGTTGIFGPPKDSPWRAVLQTESRLFVIWEKTLFEIAKKHR